MKIKIHLPRLSEAELDPKLETDITVQPRFYKRTGWVPVFYFTSIDGHGKEERHVLSVSAATKQIKVEKLVEVVPACDDDTPKKVKEKKDADRSGQAVDTAAQNQNVHGAARR